MQKWKKIYLSIRKSTHTNTHERKYLHVHSRIYYYSKRIFQQVVKTWSKIWYSIDTRKLVMSTTQKSRLLFNDFYHSNEEDAILQLNQTSGQTWIIWPHHIHLGNVLWRKYRSIREQITKKLRSKLWKYIRTCLLFMWIQLNKTMRLDCS